MSQNAFMPSTEAVFERAGENTMVVNMGPQHPSTHGVLRVICELEGEVIEFQWTNPHTWTWIDVTNADGTHTRWGLEGMSPNYLGRRGWSKGTFKPGDKIKVTIWPLKSGEPGGTLQRATLPDGSEVVNFGRGGG